MYDTELLGHGVGNVGHGGPDTRNYGPDWLDTENFVPVGLQ